MLFPEFSTSRSGSYLYLIISVLKLLLSRVYPWVWVIDLRTRLRSWSFLQRSAPNPDYSWIMNPNACLQIKLLSSSIPKTKKMKIFRKSQSPASDFSTQIRRIKSNPSQKFINLYLLHGQSRSWLVNSNRQFYIYLRRVRLYMRAQILLLGDGLNVQNPENSKHIFKAGEFLKF